jgi:hypothetical protein
MIQAGACGAANSVQQHGGGRRDAERVDLGRDRDGDLEVGGVADRGRQAVALVADTQDQAGRAADRGDVAGARSEGRGPHGGAVVAEVVDGVREVGGDGERLGEHVAHGGADRPALERVGAAAVEEDEVDGEGAGAADDRAEVGRIGEALDQQDRPRGAGEQVRETLAPDRADGTCLGGRSRPAAAGRAAQAITPRWRSKPTTARRRARSPT